MTAIIRDNLFELYHHLDYVYSGYFKQIRVERCEDMEQYNIICDDIHIFWVDEIEIL